MKQLIITIAAVVLVGCVESKSDSKVHLSINIAASEGNLEAVKQHLANGVNLNAKSETTDLTPLMSAAGMGREDVAIYLIEKGADINVKGAKNSVPLHFAAMHGKKKLVELLIAKGADVNAKSEVGMRPLDFAISSDETDVANIIFKNGGRTGAE